MHVTIRLMERRMRPVLHGSILLQMSMLHRHVIRGQQKISRTILVTYQQENARIAYQTVQATFTKQGNQPHHL